MCDIKGATGDIKGALTSIFERPQSETLKSLFDRYIDYWETLGVQARDYNQYNHRSLAQGIAMMARDYFNKTGEDRLAQHYQEAIDRLQEGMDAYGRQRSY